MKKTINEAQLSEIISKVIKESFLGDKLHSFINKGYQEGKPKSIEDTITGNGWKIIRKKPSKKTPGATLYQICQDEVPMTRYAQNPGGMSIDELMEDLQYYCEHYEPNLTVEEVPNAKVAYGTVIKVSNNNQMQSNPMDDNIAGVVSEAVKKILSNKKLMEAIRMNEYMQRESPLYNDAGEMIDPGGWYDPDDYYDPEEEDGPYDYEGDPHSMYNRIKNGEFDGDIFDDGWREKTEADNWDDYDNDGGVHDAIMDRRSVVNKDYAMAHAENPGNYKKHKVDYEKKYPMDANNNVNDDSESMAKRVLGKDGFKDSDIEKGWSDSTIRHIKQEEPALYNALFKKNGELRNHDTFMKNVNKITKYNNVADTRPLHRKGSLNRDVPNKKK